MISIELIRSDPAQVRDALRRRGEDVQVDAILELDARRRSAIAEGDELRARRNEVSRRFGKTKERPPELIEEMRAVSARIRALEGEVRDSEHEISSVVLDVPNIPADDVPMGETEADNVVVRTVGDRTPLTFDPNPHWEIGERLDIIDFARGVKVAGSRFYVLKGKGSRLQRALISWMLDLHTEVHGYQEVYLPYMVNEAAAKGSGQLPKFADTMYHDAEDDLWMVPTAEVPITNLHRDEILSVESLPLRYVAHTPCFRREKAAAGRDTRGIKRVHQFEKVEMYKFVEPEQSDAELHGLVEDAESICRSLGIQYRVLELCTGELGFASAKSFDLEMWAPGSDEWLEVSSCSNCTDFQARRASIRYRPGPGARPAFVHTLNASGLALPRVIIAILENFQQADGSVEIPEVLRPYTGFDRID